VVQGINGRWRDILSEDELALYEAAAERELTPGCCRRLENDGPI
jgi:aryl sulfotransferase